MAPPRRLPLAAGGLSDAQRLVGETATAASAVTSLAIADGVTQAVGQTNQRISGMLRALGAVFARSDDGGRRTEMHRQIGVLAQRSVLASYGQVVTRRKGPASRTGYRAGQNRLAGGVLRRALGSPEFFEAHPNGLNFGNMTMLDREAAHWARLAFGASPRGQGLHVTYEVEWSGLVVGALDIDMAPSAPVLMPRGYWANPESGRSVSWGANPPGTDVFFPGRRPVFYPTAGIEARPFLEAGLRRIAREFPLAYETYYRDLYAEFRRTGGTALANINVPVVVPFPQTTKVTRR